MRRALLTALGGLLAMVLGYSAARIPSPVASAQAQACPTQAAIVCIPVTVTPGPSATPTASATAVPSVTATPSPQATATEVLNPTPTAIVPGPTWTPGPSPTPEPIRYGLYSPFWQQRVRAGPGLNYQQVGWIGGGTYWAVWMESGNSSGDMWLMIEDRARGISGWVALKLGSTYYGNYILDNH